MPTAVGAETKNGMFKTVKASGSQQGLSSEGRVQSVKEQTLVGGQGEQGVPGRVQGHRADRW